MLISFRARLSIKSLNLFCSVLVVGGWWVGGGWSVGWAGVLPIFLEDFVLLEPVILACGEEEEEGLESIFFSLFFCILSALLVCF